MSKKRFNQDECSLTTCPLPENNKISTYQLVYLFLCWFILFADIKQVCAFNLMMFIAPVFFDLVRLDESENWIKWLTRIYFIINIFVFIIAVLEMGGALNEDAAAFIIPNTAAALVGVHISKKTLLFMVLPDVFVPIIVGIGAPTKKSMRARIACKKEFKEA